MSSKIIIVIAIVDSIDSMTGRVIIVLLYSFTEAFVLESLDPIVRTSLGPILGVRTFVPDPSFMPNP